MNKKTLILSLILLMAGICFGGATPTLDILLQGGFGNPITVVNGDFSDTSSGNSFTAPLAGWANHGTHTSNKHFLINGGLSAVSDVNAASIAEEFGIFKSGILIIGRSYTMTVDVSVVASGTYSIGSTQGGNDIVAASTSTGVQTYTFTAVGVDLCISNGSAGGNIFTFDDVTLVDESVGAWVAGAGWLVNDSASGVAAFISTGADSTLAQPTIALVDGATYKVTFTVSGIDLQDPIAYYGIQLDGNTNANTFTQNGTYVYYIQAGGSTGSGLEISSVNTTTGDTITVDDISIIVEHFKPSTNEDVIIVLGDISVPAGPDVVVNGDFQTDTDWDKGTNWEIDTGDNVAEVLIVPGATSLLTASVDPLTPGIEYLFSFDAEVSSGQLDFYMGLGFVDSATGFETVTGTAVCPQGSSRLDFEASADFLGNVSNIVIIPLTDGPIDEYADSGTHNTKIKYTSVNTHANGSGGTATWDMWWDGSTDWVISLTAGTLGTNYWDRTNASQIGDFAPNGNAIGTATTTYGPVDHSEESGSAGFETDGTPPSTVVLNTRWDYLENLKADDFGIITVAEINSVTGIGDRIVSAESAGNVGYHIKHPASQDDESFTWFGTDNLVITSNVGWDTLINLGIIANMSTGDSWAISGGSVVGEDLSVSGLGAVDSSMVMLGSTPWTTSLNSTAKFGSTFILDFSDVTTVNEAWSLGLAQAINAVTSYDPHAIAAAIAAYDSDITGHYYALNELSSGDGSNYYLLAYDIQTQTAITQGVYGLTSPSGVTGTVLVPAPSTGGGYRGRYQGLYRARYNGVGRY